MGDYEVITSGSQLKKLVEKKSEPIMKKYDLRTVELEILIFLFQRIYGDTAKEIIKMKHMSKAHVSKSIENLKSRGFILLSEDLEDRRIVHLELTQKADEVIKESLAARDECRSIMFRGISDKEQEFINQILKRVSCNIIEELKK